MGAAPFYCFRFDSPRCQPRLGNAMIRRDGRVAFNIGWARAQLPRVRT
jgi:hypothetical protein